MLSVLWPAPSFLAALPPLVSVMPRCLMPCRVKRCSWVITLPHYDYNGLREKLQATRDAEYRAGRVSEAEYRAIAKAAPPSGRVAQGHGEGHPAAADRGPEQGQGLVKPEPTPKGVDSAAQGATHTDPGGKPEPATAAVIYESAKTVESSPRVTMKEARNSLLAQIDKAATDAPRDADVNPVTLSSPRTVRGEKQYTISVTRRVASAFCDVVRKAARWLPAGLCCEALQP